MHSYLFLLSALSLSSNPSIGSGAEPISTIQIRQIAVDLNSKAGPMGGFFRHCIGAGRANEGLRADWQRQLREAKAACGFEYIRMHGLLSDDMGVYREENGRPVYNWQYIDELYDFLVELKVRPFVEFGFMPGGLASGNKTIFWWRGNVTPPRDYDKWAGLIGALTKHWVHRYGLAEVKKWYFEVWNEPNLDGFWAGTQQEYFRLYETAARAVKAVNPALRTGGPATAGAAWAPEFIQFCADSKAPVDFVSTHTYGVDVGFLDEFGGRGTVLSRHPESVIGDVKRVRQQIKDSAMPNLELHFTEWSSSYTPADPVHDSYVSAPYIIDKLKGSWPYADSMSYWTFTDIFEEAGPRTTPFHGGFGLMNYQDIKKPAFRAFEFLNKLGPTRLKCDDERALAAADANGGVQVLFWDYSNTIPAETNNQQYFITDIRPKSLGRVKLNLAGLKPGKVRIEVFRVGYRINDPYADYLALGRPAQLTRPQVAAIKKKNDGRPVSSEIATVQPGKPLLREYAMRENDVYLVRVAPAVKASKTRTRPQT